MRYGRSLMPLWMIHGTFETRVELNSDELDIMYGTGFVIHPTIEVAQTYLRMKELIPEADLYLYTDGS